MKAFSGIIIVIVAVLIHSEVSCLSDCGKIRKTLKQCHDDGKLLIFIQSTKELGNIVTFYKNSAGNLKIECYSKLGIDMDQLPDIKFNTVKSIEMHQCSLLNSTTLNELQRNFGLSGIKSLKIYSTRDSQSSVIDEKLFESFSDLESLEMITNSFVMFKENAFKSLHNVQMVNLQVYDIIALPYNVFKPLWKLETLIITNSGRMKAETKTLNFTMNSCINLEHFTLSGIRWSVHVLNLLTYNRRLTTVKINENRIKSLSENFLNGSSEVEKLFLSHNHIQYLPAKVFSTQISLIELDLNHNEIVSLDEGIFQKNVDLEILNLSHNKLSTISRKTFAGLESLINLNLDNNQFVKFNLETNLGLLKSLKVLQLSQNSINRLEGILQSHSLNHLELGNNDLKRLYIEQFWMKSNRNLVINLKGNKLESVDFGNLIASVKRDSRLLIDVGDEMICNCHTVQLANFLLGRLNISESVYEQVEVTPKSIRCVGLEDFSTETVMSVDQDSLTCPLNFPHQELCPSSCKCLRRPSDGVLIIACNNITKVPMMPPYQTLTDIKLSKIELWVVGNGIETLPSTKRDPNYNDVVEIYASRNEIRWLTIENIPKALKLLDMRFNQLTSVPSEVVMRFATIDFIQLSNNPWNCSVSLQLIKFVKTYRHIVKDFNVIRCFENQNYFIEIETDEKCEGRVLMAFAVVIFLVSLVASFYVYRHNKESVIEWIFTKEKHHLMERVYDKLKLFDGVIIASDYDEVVGKYIASKLMNKPNQFKVALTIRDWSAFEPIPEETLKNLRNARRVIIVLTENFKESDWKRWNYFNIRTRVIFVVKGQANCDNIELTNKFFMKFNDPWFWDKLKHSMTNFSEMNTESRDDTEMQLLSVSVP